MAWSVTLAAGSPPINTLGQQRTEIGPPTWGTTPCTTGQTCMSVSLAAGSMAAPYPQQAGVNGILVSLPPSLSAGTSAVNKQATCEPMHGTRSGRHRTDNPGLRSWLSPCHHKAFANLNSPYSGKVSQVSVGL